MHEKTSSAMSSKFKRWTSISQGTFPFIYLGCPIYYERRKIQYFEEIMVKINKRVMGWQSKTLSFGERFVLIANMLQSMPVYLLSAINPPKGVINRLHQMMARVFWGKTGGIKGKHWVAWGTLCYPIKEGGIGFRSLFGVGKALFAKLR